MKYLIGQGFHIDMDPEFSLNWKESEVYQPEARRAEAREAYFQHVWLQNALTFEK